jgi:hypothetical protein
LNKPLQFIFSIHFVLSIFNSLYNNVPGVNKNDNFYAKSTTFGFQTRMFTLHTTKLLDKRYYDFWDTLYIFKINMPH